MHHKEVLIIKSYETHLATFQRNNPSMTLVQIAEMISKSCIRKHEEIDRLHKQLETAQERYVYMMKFRNWLEMECHKHSFGKKSEND